MINTGEQNAATMEMPGPDWETVYELCRLAEYGVEMDMFVSDPWVVLAEIGQTDAPQSIANGYLPLLPRQAEAAKRLLEQELVQDSAMKVVQFTTRKKAH